MSEGMVASDSVVNRFHNKRPDGMSLVSVAVAVDDIEAYNAEYTAVVKEFADDLGIRTPYPIIKDQDITRWLPNWAQESARRDLVEELLEIEWIETIQITETSLRTQWIELYGDDEGEAERMNSDDFMNNVLSSYYNVVSIWKYLENGRGRGRPTENRYNIMTDDFSGKVFPAWEEVGRSANSLRVIPQGDVTYPLLATADLVMGLLKQEVYPLFAQNIYEHLKDRTVGYVDSDNIDDSELEDLVPHKNKSIRNELHYPSPTIYIDRSGMPKDKLTSLDLFAHACRYAMMENGCVKFFEENQDRDFLSQDDVIVTLNETAGHLSDYAELNTGKSIEVVTRENAVQYFTESISD